MRIVLKVGTAVLTEQNRLAKERMENLVDFIAALRETHEVLLVTSGSVAAGYTKLKMDKKFVENRQALASIGQPILMRSYQKKLEKYQIECAQLLLTQDDFDSRKRTKNARAMIEVLMQNRVLPIINENDVVAIEELTFGDNDQLSSRVAHYFDTDLLVILSDIDGYYDKDPKKYDDATIRKIVTSLSQEELTQEVAPGTHFASGGIVTKLKAANFLMQRNRKMFLTSGMNLSAAYDYLLHGTHSSGTLFQSEASI